MIFYVSAAVALLMGQALGQTVGDEIKNVRDDIRSLCYKVYGKDTGAKNCRPVSATDSQRHIVHECWKSGWSGQGSLRCKYGFDIYGTNTVNSGDQNLHPGSNGGRRRLAVDTGVATGMGSGLAEEERELPIPDGAPAALHSARFNFENLEDTKQTEVLGKYTVNNALCILQGVKVHKTEADVEPQCVVSTEGGNWTLEMVSASCTAMCIPRNVMAQTL